MNHEYFIFTHHPLLYSIYIDFNTHTFLLVLPHTIKHPISTASNLICFSWISNPHYHKASRSMLFYTTIFVSYNKYSFFTIDQMLHTTSFHHTIIYVYQSYIYSHPQKHTFKHFLYIYQ